MTGHNFINCHFCVVTIVFGHWGHNNTLVPTANKTFKTLSSTNDQKAWENTVLQASNTQKKSYQYQIWTTLLLTIYAFIANKKE